MILSNFNARVAYSNDTFVVGDVFRRINPFRYVFVFRIIDINSENGTATLISQTILPYKLPVTEHVFNINNDKLQGRGVDIYIF